MKFKLILIAPNSKSQTFKVTNMRFVIGRSASANLRINSLSVSRKHCEIFEKNGKSYIRDLNSSNGTRLNGERLDSIKKLKSGGQLQIGKFVFQIASLDEPKTEEKKNSYSDSDIDLSHLKIDLSESDSGDFDLSKLKQEDENGTTPLNISVGKTSVPDPAVGEKKDFGKTVSLLHPTNDSNEESDGEDSDKSSVPSKKKIRFSPKKEFENTAAAADDVLKNFFGRR